MYAAPAMQKTDPVFGAAFYAPYESAMCAAFEAMCAVRDAHKGDVLALRLRLKTPASIRGKLQKKGLPQSAQAAGACLHDVAGLRAVLKSRAAVYRFADALAGCAALSIDGVHDYIAFPKESGYRSLHLIARARVLCAGESCLIPVEIQLRTADMDAWACMEHRLIYKPVKA